MGLDLVELAMRIEETFSIQIPDRVASQLTTPGKVTDYILTQVGDDAPAQACLSQRAFHLLRTTLLQHLTLERHQIRLETPLKEIIPSEGREALWQEIGVALGAKKWPAMSRPKLLAFIPTRVKNVKDVVEYIVSSEPLVVKGKERAWTRAEVWEALRLLIIDETAVTDFTEDSRFVEDMHLD